MIKNNLIVILLAVLFISCNKTNNEDYHIINEVIEFRQDFANSILITEFDTLEFNRFILNNSSVISLDIDANNIISFDKISVDSIYYERFFHKKEYDFVKNQIDEDFSIVWDKEFLNYDSLSDSSYCDGAENCPLNLGIINNYVKKGNDYLLLSKPVYNEKRNSALIYSGLYTKQHYINGVLELKKKYQDWDIEFVYFMITEIVEESTSNGKYVNLYSVFKGELWGDVNDVFYRKEK